MAVADEADAWRRLVASLAEWHRLIDGASPGMRTVEGDGYVATITPAAPERSVLNSVVPLDPDRFLAAYDEVAAAYEDAGIIAWTVWVPEHETALTRALGDRGHMLDADPEAMICDLDRIERPPEPPGFDTEADPATIAAINDAAYSTDGFSAAFAGLGRRDGMHCYTAGEGDPAAGVIAFDKDGDCSVWLVATRPEARGRGLASALMAHALADGRDRGCTTSTLEGTDLGRPVYLRLGYESLGEIEMWEKRKPT